MKTSIGTALVTAALVFGVPAAIDATAASAKATVQKENPTGASDVSARRSYHRHHDRYAHRVDYPYYYERPYYYRPYPYLLPAPFIFGFGFGSGMGPW